MKKKIISASIFCSLFSYWLWSSYASFLSSPGPESCRAAEAEKHQDLRMCMRSSYMLAEMVRIPDRWTGLPLMSGESYWCTKHLSNIYGRHEGSCICKICRSFGRSPLSCDRGTWGLYSSTQGWHPIGPGALVPFHR
ncbi:hypothetical protein F5Y19DRAFT_68177 [Xylariaceae sp. FL1651]|nr:hypothetical protein F5Y19DRAFT_68177 [Xylariaceae sp. FL1651]